MKSGTLVLIVAKIEGDILVGGHDAMRKNFLKRLAEVYKIWSVVHLHSSFQFFRRIIEQDESGTIRLSAEDRLRDISSHTWTRLCHKAAEESNSVVELFSFQSVAHVRSTVWHLRRNLLLHLST